MRTPGWISCFLAAALLADVAVSRPFTFSDPAFVGQSSAPARYSLTMNYLALTNAAPGTLLTVPVIFNGMIPTNTLYGLMFSDTALNQFTVSTNGPAFPAPIQIGNSVYSGTEAHTIPIQAQWKF